jgi:hypothetical protein
MDGPDAFALHLREALWLAGILRPLDGFEDARQRWQEAAEALALARRSKAPKAE